jgi:hypothetical protein
MSDDRRLLASYASNMMWAKCENRSARTLTARQAFLEKLERQVDPSDSLPAEERAKRVKNLQQAHMQKMALRASQARRVKAAARRAAAKMKKTLSCSTFNRDSKRSTKKFPQSKDKPRQGD